MSSLSDGGESAKTGKNCRMEGNVRAATAGVQTMDYSENYM